MGWNRIKMGKIESNIKNLKWILPLFLILLNIGSIIIGLVNEHFYRSKFYYYVAYLWFLPLRIFGGGISRIPCDGLGCLIFFFLIVLITIIFFYGIIGYILGYILERLIKK